MRRLPVCLSLIVSWTVTHYAGQNPQQPADVFRGRVDLITVHVVAVDGRGLPVEDLRPRDFSVKVDGRERPVVSAELIKVVAGAAGAAPGVSADNPLIATNAVAPDARRVVLAVDQTLIRSGAITPLLRTASRFVERLTPNDHVAFITFPEPGPRVDFTTDKARVRTALDGIIGQPIKRPTRQFNLSLWEAFTISGQSLPQDTLVSTNSRPSPTVRRVLERGCDGYSWEDLQLPENADRLLQCRRDVYTESLQVAFEAGQDADISLRALEFLLKELVPLDGRTSVTLVSAGLVNHDPTRLDELARLAAEARTSINVIAVDPEREQEIRSLPNDQSTTGLVDRSYEMQGLELIADRTGGTLYRGVAAAEGVFDRLQSEMSGWYVVAVERQARGPERTRLEVDVKRRGVTLRSNRTVLTGATTASRPMEEVLNDTLSSPVALPGVPLRLSTFAQRDSAPGKYQLRFAVQIGQPGAPAGEFALGYVLLDDHDRVVALSGSRRTLAPPAGGAEQALVYDTALSAAPGTYSLRFGVVDADGRRGSVVHRVRLEPIADSDVASSDLIVGSLPEDGELVPAVEPQVSGAPLAGYVELYLHDADPARVDVSLDIAEGEASPTLAVAALTLRPGRQPSWPVATGVVDASIAPGHYVARATIRRDGAVVRVLSRPFVVVRDPQTAAKVSPARRAAMSADMHRRTAAYVAGVVRGLENVAAQEEFVLSRPDRRVTSDLVLVRYPGADRDWILHRDVRLVDGKARAGREQSLLEIFASPTAGFRERARQIMLDGDAYVPSVFNPMFVVGFLQSDFQSHFEFTMADAGAEWPREVKAVTFIETARPTLIRTGPFGDLDVPSRGTAWIEEGTGRVLQTELRVGLNRSPPTMTTRFRLDERLQVTVPEMMRTQNPDGTATYTSFRRFDVTTITTIPLPTPD